jgi:aldehyde dehydrogenase (NAD+)
LEKLEYGPAPESASVADKWIESHGGKFGLFVDGKWVSPPNRTYTDSVNPCNGKLLAKVVDGDPKEDVDLAVKSARAAQPKWASLSGFERAKYMYAIARQIQKHARLFAVVEALDNGKTVRETRDVDVPLAIRHFYYHAGWAQLMDTELKDFEPLGVVAQVVPWNFPLLMLSWKIAPAMAMGNTVVLKPAPSTMLSTMLLAEVLAEAGLPPGVVNFLPGGNDLGFALVNHADVDKVAFTGSTGVGRLLRRSTAGSGKKLTLELGGKSPFVVMDDADLDAAVEGVVSAIFFNQGQVCCAGSRCLVQESVYDRFLAKVKRRVDNLRIGDSLDKCVDVGAINSRRQLDSIAGYVESARAEGAAVWQSSVQRVPPASANGFFFPPTLIYDVSTTSRCVVDEIFGPVVAIMPFRSPAEAVALANNTCYGLASSVWSETLATAFDLAFRIKAGVVWINCHNMFDAAAGFGGVRESGFGRESGREGLHEYVRHAWQQPKRNTFSAAQIAAPWGADIAPTPPIPGQVSREPLALTSSSSASSSSSPSLAAPEPQIRRVVDRTLKMYIGGRQARPDAPYARVILSALDKRTVIGEVGEGNRKDIRNAVEAAHAASSGWGKRAAYNRAQILYFVAENLDARHAEFAERVHAQTGCGLDAARDEVSASIERLFYWAAFADKFGGAVQETPLYGATVRIHEPVGVIGIACPDERPLLGFISLLAPAIVRANTVVIVPSERFPLSACDLFQVFETSDVPAGVVNIVTGARDVLVKTLVDHMDVQALWYFGSEPIGSYHVEHRSAANLKRTWCNYGVARDWTSPSQGQGREFLYHATQAKNIWAPAGV